MVAVQETFLVILYVLFVPPWISFNNNTRRNAQMKLIRILLECDELGLVYCDKFSPSESALDPCRQLQFTFFG
jgi:hypothetical protein